jgi:DNA-binding PadR family transcriptional regulator
MSNDTPSLGEFEQLVLLAVLRLGEDAYAVPVRALLEDKAGRAVSRGALYTSLERLETKGLLDSHMSEPLAIRGGRARRYFTVTKRGVQALRAAYAAVASLAQGLDSVLGKRR